MYISVSNIVQVFKFLHNPNKFYIEKGSVLPPLLPQKGLLKGSPRLGLSRETLNQTKNPLSMKSKKYFACTPLCFLFTYF